MMKKLKPGKKLDELIARKVMGWRTDGPNTALWDRGNGTYLFKDKFKPSTDISAAWDLTKTVYGVWTISSCSKGWNCTLATLAGPFDKIVESGVQKTAEHAICLVALKALS